MPRPNFIQAPTLRQYVSVFNTIRKVRKTVAKGEMSPDDAVELRLLMDVMESEFQLACGNDNDTAEQIALAGALNRENCPVPALSRFRELEKAARRDRANRSAG